MLVAARAAAAAVEHADRDSKSVVLVITERQMGPADRGQPKEAMEEMVGSDIETMVVIRAD